MKKVLKFTFEGKEGFLSVVEDQSSYYTLVQKDTPKVASIQLTHRLFISYELKQPVFHEVNATVIVDKNVIRDVYHQLEKENNLYFKELNDTLCVIKIDKESH